MIVVITVKEGRHLLKELENNINDDRTIKKWLQKRLASIQKDD